MTDTTATPATVETNPIPEGHVRFNLPFRKEKIRDTEGKELGETKKIPNIVVDVPAPTDIDLINFMSDPTSKPAIFIRELVQDAIKAGVRGQLNTFREENPEAAVTPSVLDFSKLTFEALSSMDRRERAPEIPEEQWNSMYEDYKAVMLSLGQQPERVNKHVNLFKTQFRTARYDKPALNLMKDRLNLYGAKTENMDDHADCYAVLQNKLDKYLKAEEKNLVNAL